ncbi:MAG: 16S rRNA (cytosine(967)-C(5))-methyltransferase RsmB [Clostridia bacterium]|nr:16S rRNA (cytosine(967)-C(5))-methyltransferase RsmB [Clostridia bacterium]
MKTNVRKLALELLCRAEREDRFVNLSLPHVMQSDLSAEDKNLLVALLYGVTEKRVSLDYYISVLSGRSKDKIGENTLNILRMGLYQLMYMDKIPSFAAVNESVKLTKNKGEASFVNAVLRSYERKKDELIPPERERSLKRHLSIKYSFPQNIVKHFISQYGETEAEEILSAFSRELPLSLRVNTLKLSRDELLARLREEGVKCEKSELSPNGILVYDKTSPEGLSGFSDGLFFVQDVASQLECEALKIKEGDLLIDVCACPGGKSFGAAMKMNDRGRVISLDIHESKLSLIEKGAKRLSISSIEARAHDSREALTEYIEKADCVICDAPCSGLGVLAKKPDLRHRDFNFEELIALSREILSASARYVKKGGYLVFSTCTLNKDENEETVKDFLLKNPDFAPSDFRIGQLESENGMLTLFPHKHGCDGFFISRMVRL